MENKKTPKDWFIEQDAEIGQHLKEELEKLIESKKYYQYVKDSKSDNGLNIYNAYGDYENNRLYMTITVGDKIGYGRVKSGVFWPAMIDRMFGIDQQDSQWLSFLGDALCYIYDENHTLEEWMDQTDKEARKNI